MGLDEILNPMVKSDHNIFDITDKDIYGVVMDAKEVQEKGSSDSTWCRDP